jgi:simple sugar transport system ATP-binding protein
MNSSASPPPAGQAPPRLQLTGITKRYPAVVANSGVSLSVQPGEIHAVLGENGAGKSTLMKVIYGAVRPDEGSVQFDGRTVQVRNPQEARQLGIAMVFQHFSLFDTLTVAENVWLGLDKASRWPKWRGASLPRRPTTVWTSTPSARCTRSAWARCSGSRSSARC